MSRIVPFSILGLSAVLLALGVTLPIMRFEQLYFFSNEPSLLQLVGELWSDGSAGLAIAVCAFSLVFPAAKLIVLAAEVVAGDARSGVLHRAMPHLSRWSMMDVMLVAIVIFAAKTSGLATAVTLPGFWCYAASAVIAAIFPSVVKLGKTDRQSEKG
ncbi:paraquat-inducible protein A [Aliirhizobium smilacinae]|uniref:Paraquat-inducible protein A n=1 Tax=Aliirhizobium smilacinae TaxID=1395944 RepID=A0A5C4XJF2_9HYPH|nr:paraquat-inducible protein A [Rhizobium smilacinae]TNM62760.1 paraquat-inducible protein A [Rhizobium smilacinae]